MNEGEWNYVPIDFIKAKIIGLSPQHFSNNPRLSPPKSIYDGELLTKTIYKYENLTIKIFENNDRIEFSGSLHTFYNDGRHNYNDFSSTSFNNALRRLNLELGIKPENLYLIHVEWGYNISPPTETNYILDRLIQHNSVNKTVGLDCKVEGKFIQFKHSTNFLKTYNKGQHFKLEKEVLRIELKQINWSKYRQQGIKTLSDFINANKIQFIAELLHQWNRVIFYDINSKQTQKYIHYQTSTYWDDLRKNRSNKNFKYHFDKLKRLNQTLGFDTQNQITVLLIKKGNELQL